ncbi:toprim domain-containing protein [Paenibacillus pini]|uniref:Toprim domain protein n=1 Tax=Paenibacillus pini JCM 16418 TaxID=1236976 RepID=W7Z067_9BACL|nr:toprim domain-containing protein [Paenibacillus pini]GAF08009.1 toprim domain protein [Paenibacillus pini JCM 16418]
MSIFIIVEGKNDRSKLRRLLDPEINIVCTFGTLNSLKLESLIKRIKHDEVYLFMDNDSSGKKIRGVLRDAFPDAAHLYTRRGYPGVEGTPNEYLIAQLEKAGLDEFIIYPDPNLPWVTKT